MRKRFFGVQISPSRSQAQRFGTADGVIARSPSGVVRGPLHSKSSAAAGYNSF
ncbi:hypothetical protein RGE_17730 [Rubrivivax gelatinosus IL144]|uniref:Uncharacterized protein n=1 Tax=Rubrivivax gelatinosus (strain NBRC 100245 / IL144) TaxID=983917 RepID=I0HQ27_RUBGI|nr:hypothetical protein RGE_17730 [Rubrivivax gelatinosus IL144]